MNKNILKQFTFGFEIEGNFAESLKDNLDGENFKEDGSVGSDERIRLPASFHAINLGESDEECDRCDGTGQFREECNCERETHCEHEHELSCYTSRVITQCYERYGNNLLDTILNHFNADNCDHNCAEEDCPGSYPCEDDDDYHVVDCEECGGSGNNSGSGLAQEYASDKFSSIETLLKELAIFKSGGTDLFAGCPKPNHIWNRTCGLHLHIGKKPTNKLSYKQLWNAVANIEFLRALHAQASNWCECQRKRLLRDNDHYYTMFKNPIDLIETYQHQYPLRNWGDGQPSEKFRFLRFHDEYKTLEFRFLSPCKHKVENVEKLISFLTDYLGSSNIWKSEAKVTDKSIHENLKVTVPIGQLSYKLTEVPWSRHQEFVEIERNG